MPVGLLAEYVVVSGPSVALRRGFGEMLAAGFLAELDTVSGSSVALRRESEGYRMSLSLALRRGASSSNTVWLCHGFWTEPRLEAKNFWRIDVVYWVACG